MLSINKTVLFGNMAHDPEFRTFPSGDRIACFTVCTSEKWKDRATGELKERTEWHKVQARERHTVDYLDRFAQKGTRVYVEGILRTRKVPSNDGGPDRYFTELDANIVSLEKIVLRIQNAVHEATGMKFNEYTTKSRKRDGFFARMIFVHHCHANGIDPIKYILRDRTMIYHYLNQYHDETRYNPNFRVLAEKVESILDKTINGKA